LKVNGATVLTHTMPAGTQNYVSLMSLAGTEIGGPVGVSTTFDDFEFAWEWRLPQRANNGVKYFVTEARQGAPGHEYQMVDDATTKGPESMTGSFYAVLPRKDHKPIKFFPESNYSRIVVRGNHVEHWLNGEKVLEYECGSDEVKANVAKSKFKKTPGFGEKLKGHILLTDHTDECWFRNLKIRELPSQPPVAEK
ncbi:MAG: DUF1080 domain-containing protein, partial [Verrucomicrobiae bacterium]|nr:DUF1080 domain-containing protein [Verrucomicrobiae bacterium]